MKEIIGFKGSLYFNTDKAEGTMRKLTDSSKLHSLGCEHKTKPENGVRKIYEYYCSENKTKFHI